MVVKISRKNSKIFSFTDLENRDYEELEVQFRWDEGKEQQAQLFKLQKFEKKIFYMNYGTDKYHCLEIFMQQKKLS